MQEGVNMVMHALEYGWGGEIFIPKIPSYNILDVAKAIDENCETKIIGLRPGEKLHEEMITESDSLNTYDMGTYYVILPTNPTFDLSNYLETFNAKKVDEGFAYNSKTNSLYETVKSLNEKIYAFQNNIS